MGLFYYIWPIISFALIILLGLLIGSALRIYKAEGSKDDAEAGKT